MDYAEKLKDPRWQKKRLEILQRDHYCCQICGRINHLEIHHLKYTKSNPWEEPEENLITLCHDDHAVLGGFAEKPKYIYEDLPRLISFKEVFERLLAIIEFHRGMNLLDYNRKFKQVVLRANATGFLLHMRKFNQEYIETDPERLKKLAEWSNEARTILGM
jgi:hypothetical protein